MGLQHWWKTGAAPNDYEFALAEEGGVPLMVEKRGRGLPMADPMRRG
jgi:hypothetical protein